MATSEERAAELLDLLRQLFATKDSFFVDALLASRLDPGGGFTLVWSVGEGRYVFGKSWDMGWLDRAFSGEDPELLAEDIWFGEIDEPNGPGTRDPGRARGLVVNAEDVRWLDRG